jgi:hypothetical protein
MGALNDSPRPGKEPTITDATGAWVISLACRNPPSRSRSPKKVGYPRELWTTRLLARYVRENARMAGHPCLTRLAPGRSARSSTARDHEYQRHGNAEPARRDRPAHRQGSRLRRKSPSFAGIRRLSQEKPSGSRTGMIASATRASFDGGDAPCFQQPIRIVICALQAQCNFGLLVEVQMTGR